MSLVRFRSKAYLLKKVGRVAQAVEHLTFNQVVRGSNPRTLIVLLFFKFCNDIIASVIMFNIFYNPMSIF